MVKRPALGRGLASLIPEAEPQTSAPPQADAVPEEQRIQLIPVELIDAGRYQPRKEFDDAALAELIASVKEKGVLSPLLTRRQDGRYELIAGERRLRAAKAAGLDVVPVIVRNVDDRETLELSLIENIQRDDLNAIELALAFRQLQEEFGHTQEEISQRVGKDRTTVANHLRLLKAAEPVKLALLEGRISMGHARAILGLEEDEAQNALLERILAQELSVRQTETEVKRIREPEGGLERTPPRKPPAPKPPLSVEMRHVTDKLRRAMQTEVEIIPRKQGGGEIRIAYYNLDELNRILELLPES